MHESTNEPLADSLFAASVAPQDASRWGCSLSAPCHENFREDSGNLWIKFVLHYSVISSNNKHYPTYFLAVYGIDALLFSCVAGFLSF